MQNPYGPLELLGFGEIDLCVIAELQLKLEVQLNSRGCTEEGTSCHGFGYVCSALHPPTKRWNPIIFAQAGNYLCQAGNYLREALKKLFLGIILSQV